MVIFGFWFILVLQKVGERIYNTLPTPCKKAAIGSVSCDIDLRSEECDLLVSVWERKNCLFGGEKPIKIADGVLPQRR